MRFSDPRIQAVLEEFNARSDAEQAERAEMQPGEFGPRRDEFLLPVGEKAGHFLRSLAIGAGSQSLCEMGTSYGYSTLFLADAAKATGGHVTSFDTEGYKQDYAAEMLEKAGLASYVTFRCGDGVEMVREGKKTFDFVLIDIWKGLYEACFEACYGKLEEGGLILADNMIEPEGTREMGRALREAARAKPDLQQMLLPVGSGIEAIIRWSEGNPVL